MTEIPKQKTGSFSEDSWENLVLNPFFEQVKVQKVPGFVGFIAPLKRIRSRSYEAFVVV